MFGGVFSVIIVILRCYLLPIIIISQSGAGSAVVHKCRATIEMVAPLTDISSNLRPTVALTACSAKMSMKPFLNPEEYPYIYFRDIYIYIYPIAHKAHMWFVLLS